MVEFVIVEFPERRRVFIGNKSHGFNTRNNGEWKIFRLNQGTHTFHLGGENNYAPEKQKVVVKNTDPIDPMKVVFQKVIPPPEPEDTEAPAPTADA